MGLVRDNGVTNGVSNVDIPGEPQPTGRTLEEAAAEIGQRPLLPAEVPPGVTVAVARRSRRRLAEFHRWGLADASPIDEEEEEVAQVCVLIVSETSLVHYTKRPKPLGKSLSAAAGHDARASRGSAEVAGAEPPVDEKYWKRRYNYFARFDEGVRMDTAAWFEVTPESVARHIADRLKYNLVVDGTCGVGGNAIQFALTSQRVIAVDTMAARLEDAAHNASIYGVKDRIEFVCDDFAHFAETYQGPQIDAVFLSPPWGGPAHLDAQHFALKDVECPDIVRLFAAAAVVSQRVILYLPRHADLHEMVLLASAHGFAAVEVEKIFFEYPTPHLKLCVIYFWPEAAACPPPLAQSSKKKVGPTGKSTSEVAHKRSMQATGQQVLCKTRLTGPCGLFGLPPLVGPLFRAIYCRFHYVGRYVVAAALAFERQQAAQATTCNIVGRGRAALTQPKHTPRAVPTPSQGKVGNKLQARTARKSSKERGASPQPECIPTMSTGGLCHPALRTPVASAMCQALDEGCASEAAQEAVAQLTWLLAEVPLLHLLHLAGDASAKASAVDTVVRWNAQLLLLLRQRLPEVYRRMLDWRKTNALQAPATTAAT